MRLIKLFTLIAVVSSATVFAAQSHAPQADGVYDQSKTYITVTANQPQFTLKLKSNPTTGYSWFLHEYNHELVTPIKHQYLAPAKGLVGAGGYDMWTFKMKPAAFSVPQQTSIHMIYARPWQANDNPSQVVFFVSTQAN